MNNMLSTARAVIIDDKYSEVEAAIRALAKMGIGAVYLSGKLEEIPPNPLHGIRLAVVDMDLGLGATGQSAADTARQTLEFLKAVLAEDSNPLMVVVWTGSEEVFEEFKKGFGDVLTGATPALICRLDKTTFDLTTPGGVDAAAAAFRDLIIGEHAKVRPLDVLWAWEQAVHDAASRTTSMIAEIVDAPGMKPHKWRADASNLLAALARAAAGKHNDDARSLLDDLLGSFEPLLLDRIEHHRLDDFEALEESAGIIRQRAAEQIELAAKHAEFRSEFADHEAFKKTLADVQWADVNIIANKDGSGLEENAGRRRAKVLALAAAPVRPAAPAVGPEQAARLNGMLQWSVLPPDTKGLRPGNVYLIEEGPVRDAVLRVGVDLEQFKKDTLFKGELAGQSILVEATPACDYAQGKWTMPRFVLGYLVPPESFQKLPTTTEFLRPYGSAAFTLPGAGQSIVHMVLNSHFAISVGMTEAAEWTPILRLRKSTLVEMQVWLASQHMRQGLLNVTP